MGLYVQGGKKVGGMYMADGRGNATKIGGMYYADGKGNATKFYSSYLPTGYVIFDGGGYATAFNDVFSIKWSIGTSSPEKIKIVKTNKVTLPFSINNLKTGIVISFSKFAFFNYDESSFYSTPLNYFQGFNSPKRITKEKLLKGYVYGKDPADGTCLSIKLVGNSLAFGSTATISNDAPSGTYGTAIDFDYGGMYFLLVDSIKAY